MAIKDLVPRLVRGREQVPVRHVSNDPFQDLQRQMNRLFDEFFGDYPVAARGGSPWGLAAAGFTPRVDVAETARDVTVSAELPGMDEKDITVELADDALTLRGERKEEKEDKGRNWYTREQSYGTFRRTVALPASVDGGKAKASFRKGVLTVTVPKRPEEQAQRKTIKIQAE